MATCGPIGNRSRRAALASLSARHDELGAAAVAWLAVAELSRGHGQEALAAAQRALSMDPGNTVACYALAIALRNAGSPEAGAWLRRGARTPGNSRRCLGDMRNGAMSSVLYQFYNKKRSRDVF